MTGPDLQIELAAAALRPGGTLTGAFVLPGGPPPGTERVEFSVLWHTAGKGTEDLGVVHHRAWAAADGTLGGLPNTYPFEVPLPPTPWSYDGTLVSVRWVARVRVRDEDGADVVRDAPFTLRP
jgi:hypothetical protein